MKKDDFEADYQEKLLIASMHEYDRRFAGLENKMDKITEVLISLSIQKETTNMIKSEIYEIKKELKETRPVIDKFKTNSLFLKFYAVPQSFILLAMAYKLFIM